MLGIAPSAWLLPYLPDASLRELDIAEARYQTAKDRDKQRLLQEFAVSGSVVERMTAARFVAADELAGFIEDGDILTLAMAASRPDYPHDLLVGRLRRAAQDPGDPVHGSVGPLAAVATHLELAPPALEALCELWLGALEPEQKCGDAPLTPQQEEQAVRQFLWRPQLKLESYLRLREILREGYESKVLSDEVLRFLADEARTTDDEQRRDFLWQLGNPTIAAGVAANPHIDVKHAVALLRAKDGQICRGAASNEVVPMDELRSALNDHRSRFLHLLDGGTENANIDEATLRAGLDGLIDHEPPSDQALFASCLAKLFADARLPFARLLDALPKLRAGPGTSSIIDAALERDLSEDDANELFMRLACDSESPAVRSAARNHASCPAAIEATSALIS